MLHLNNNWTNFGLLVCQNPTIIFTASSVLLKLIINFEDSVPSTWHDPAEWREREREVRVSHPIQSHCNSERNTKNNPKSKTVKICHYKPILCSRNHSKQSSNALHPIVAGTSESHKLTLSYWGILHHREPKLANPTNFDVDLWE